MDKMPFIFDFFVVDDLKFEQYYLYQNLWRETLLLSHFDDPRIAKVKDFGQLPNKVIYREIEELPGMTLNDYINDKIDKAQHDPNRNLSSRNFGAIHNDSNTNESNVAASEAANFNDENHENLS